jgi:hypothetical protein
MTTLESNHHAKHKGKDAQPQMQLWPMDATITGIRVDLGGTGTAGGTPQISNYFGYPFFYHVKSSAGNGVDIAIDENAPSTYDPAITTKVAVNSVTLTYTYYQPDNTPVTQTMTSTSPGGQYLGGPLSLCIEFSDDLTTGTLVVEALPAPQQDTGTKLGIVVVSKDNTSNKTTRGYFVRVPITAGLTTGTLPTTAGIHWPASGGMAGPVGGGQVP